MLAMIQHLAHADRYENSMKSDETLKNGNQRKEDNIYLTFACSLIDYFISWLFLLKFWSILGRDYFNVTWILSPL